MARNRHSAEEIIGELRDGRRLGVAPRVGVRGEAVAPCVRVRGHAALLLLAHAAIACQGAEGGHGSARRPRRQHPAQRRRS